MRTTWLVAAVIAVAALGACERAEPEARFRQLTEPFPAVSPQCWPFAAPAPFTARWFTRSATLEAGRATVAVDVFDTDPATIGTQLDRWTLAAGPAGSELRVEVEELTGSSADPVTVTITGEPDEDAQDTCLP